MNERPRVNGEPDRTSNSTRPIEITRVETLTPIDASALWARLLYDKHPEISHIVLAYYPKSREGDEYHRFSTSYLEDHGYLRNSDYPKVSIDSSFLMCAISCIVGTSEFNGDVPKYSPYDNPDLVLPNPQSFIHMDFITKSIPSPGILWRTIRSLQKLQYDWYILCTGLSYHLIIDHLVDVEEIPWYWGDVIARFTRSSLSEFERIQGLRYAGLLKAAKGDLDLLEKIVKVERILRRDNRGYGYHEPEEDVRLRSPIHILDWSHFYHTLDGLVSFYKGWGVGAGYLRISPKNQYPPPFVVAQKEGEIITQFDIPTSFYDEHIKPGYLGRFEGSHVAFSWDPVDLEEALWISGADEEEITAFLAILEELDDLDKSYLLETRPFGIEAVLARRMGRPIDALIISLAGKLYKALKIL